MEDQHLREHFDTGLNKIRQEIKGRLVPHGLFGSVTNVDTGSTGPVPAGSKVEITVKGKVAERSFDREQIEGCRLRVGGAVLLGIISMVEELST